VCGNHQTGAIAKHSAVTSWINQRWRELESNVMRKRKGKTRKEKGVEMEWKKRG
jgi:hypothetical protein